MEEVMPEIQEWKIEGGWFDVCRCDVPCPCSWAQPPDDGFCEGILLWHIREGNYGKVRLDGLNVAMIVTFRGNVWEKATSMAQALFMDERADEAQRGALQMVFSGAAGGWPKQFGELTQGSETKGMEFATIKVEVAQDLSSWRAEVPGKLMAAAKALRGPTSSGKNPEVRNLPGAETGPGGLATWGKATAHTADAFGLKWDHGAGKSSKYIAFEWSGPDRA
jgi:hypothetical protein